MLDVIFVQYSNKTKIMKKNGLGFFVRYRLMLLIAMGKYVGT